MTEGRNQVLVVDDDDGIRKLEADVLCHAGYEVEQASGGAAAIEKLEERRRDLVLLDLLMPDVDGWAVLRFIRAMQEPPRVLIVSGLGEVVPPGDLSHCIAGCVHKPFNLGGLLKICADILAAPALSQPASGSRKEPRRTFVVETTLLSEGGTPVALGHLLEVSSHGFRLEMALALMPGDPVNVAFRIPGRDQPLQLMGRVRWRKRFVMGAEVSGLSEQDASLLKEIVASRTCSQDPEGPEAH